MKQLQIFQSGYGHYRVSTEIRGKEYSCVTTNTQAIDRYLDTDVPDRVKQWGYTRAQAASALYNEIVRANAL